MVMVWLRFSGDSVVPPGRLPTTDAGLAEPGDAGKEAIPPEADREPVTDVRRN